MGERDTIRDSTGSTASSGIAAGPTLDAFRRLSDQPASADGGARARRVLHMVLRARAVADSEAAVGWIRYLGRGDTYISFTAEVRPDPTLEASERWVVRVNEEAAGHDPEIDSRTAREARLLQWLARHKLPFRVPEVLAVMPEADGLALVARYIGGRHLDFRSTRGHTNAPWDVVARTAAGIHHIDPTPLRALLPGFDTRRAHARAAIATLEGAAAEAPEVADAVTRAASWGRRHLPPEIPTRLLHGALLGSHILVANDDAAPAVIGWESAQLGDPACELARVTRGERRPFNFNSGQRRLLSAYRAYDGAVIGVAHIHLYEVALAAERCALSPTDATLHRAFDELVQRVCV